MGTELTPDMQILDLTGLPESVVQEVKRLVQEAREKQAAGTARANGAPIAQGQNVPTPIARPQLSAEELDRLIDELSSGPPGKVLPADFTRADVYDDHD
jgi:hypothetical protein